MANDRERRGLENLPEVISPQHDVPASDSPLSDDAAFATPATPTDSTAPAASATPRADAVPDPLASTLPDPQVNAEPEDPAEPSDDDSTGAVLAADFETPYVPQTDYKLPPKTPSKTTKAGLPHWAVALLGALLAGILIASAIITGGFGLLTRKQVPNVVGYAEQDARDLLEAEGLKVSVQEPDTQSINDNGRVLATTPSSGEETMGTVTIMVGKVSSETQRVPMLVGLSEQDALDQITATSFFVKDDITYAYSDTIAKGVVISQGPIAGSQKTKGTKIDLVISAGPEPAGSSSSRPSGDAATITIPDLQGMAFEDAKTLLTGMGLVVERGNDVTSSDNPVGTVDSVEPAMGTTASVGSTVVVHVVAAPEE